MAMDNRQRKAMFARLNSGNPRSRTLPVMTRTIKPMLTKTEREFIGRKIRKNIREGCFRG